MELINEKNKNQTLEAFYQLFSLVSPLNFSYEPSTLTESRFHFSSFSFFIALDSVICLIVWFISNDCETIPLNSTVSRTHNRPMIKIVQRLIAIEIYSFFAPLLLTTRNSFLFTEFRDETMNERTLKEKETAPMTSAQS